MSGRSHAVDKQGQIAPGVIASDASDCTGLAEIGEVSGT
jgi:hypothetical protein